MNLSFFFHRRRERERLADNAMRAKGTREGRVFIEDWRHLRTRGYNVPDGGLLSPRPAPPPTPPRSPK